MTNENLTDQQAEALENELVDLGYKDSEWTQKDLDRQAELVRILTAAGRM